MSSRLVTLEALADLLPRHARLLGVDLGTKTVGLALSDVERRIATPLTTIVRTKFSKDAEKLIDEIKRFEIFAVVVGLPLNMDGSEGQRAPGNARVPAQSGRSAIGRLRFGTSASRLRRSTAR